MIDEYLQNNNSNPTEAAQRAEIHSVEKDCLTSKSDICIVQNNKSCNKWMNEKCFKAKKDFMKSKKEFMKFPNDLGRRLIFMNVKKRCKKIHYLTERAFKEKNLYKTAAFGKKDKKLFLSSVKALL